MTGTTMTCGDTGACHSNHLSDNHGVDHDYTSASQYTQTADTVGSEAGCAASGAGCHDSAATGNAINTFHSALTAAAATHLRTTPATVRRR